MRKVAAFVSCFAGVLMLTQAHAVQVAVPMEYYYAYDKNAPLNAEVKPLQMKTSAVKGYEIFFDSVHDERVSSVLYVPNTGKKSYPCFLFLHGYGMERELPELALQVIGQEGYAVFAISLKYTNERKIPGKDLASENIVRLRDAVIQTVIDFRRGMDYLETRQDIDSRRIGVLGLSMGTIIGSVLFSVDDRIRVAGFGVGGADFEVLASHSVFLGPAFDLRKFGFTEEMLRNVAAPMDAVNFARLSKGRPVFMVNGRYDQIIPPAAAKSLYEAFSEPKHIEWFEGGHVPSMTVILSLVKDLLDWFKKFLLPEKLPVMDAGKNQPPVVTKLTIKAPPEGVMQGQTVRFEANAEDPDKNMAFVRAYIEGADTEALLFDDGNAKNADKKANDGIYSGRTLISTESKTGETKVRAVAVDFNGDVSKALFSSFEILPITYPENSHAPEIVKHNVPEKLLIGKKAELIVEAKDADADLASVEATVEEFGLSVELERDPKQENVFKFKLDIPDLVPAGTYHVSLWAKDKLGRKSKKVVQEVILEMGK